MEYLFAVQSKSGHELVSAVIEPAKVGDVDAVVQRDGRVAITHLGETVQVSEGRGDDLALQLHRWPADDKLSKPVSHNVR